MKTSTAVTETDAKCTVSKKFPPLNSVELSLILTDFRNFRTVGEHTKFATSNLHCFSPHPDYVATLPWEVKSPNMLKITKHTTQKLYHM